MILLLNISLIANIDTNPTNIEIVVTMVRVEPFNTLNTRINPMIDAIIPIVDEVPTIHADFSDMTNAIYWVAIFFFALL